MDRERNEKSQGQGSGYQGGQDEGRGTASEPNKKGTHQPPGDGDHGRSGSQNAKAGQGDGDSSEDSE